MLKIAPDIAFVAAVSADAATAHVRFTRFPQSDSFVAARASGFAAIPSFDDIANRIFLGFGAVGNPDGAFSDVDKTTVFSAGLSDAVAFSEVEETTAFFDARSSAVAL